VVDGVRGPPECERDGRVGLDLMLDDVLIFVTRPRPAMILGQLARALVLRRLAATGDAAENARVTRGEGARRPLDFP